VNAEKKPAAVTKNMTVTLRVTVPAGTTEQEVADSVNEVNIDALEDLGYTLESTWAREGKP
jgi:hypothetical protein